MKVVRANGWNYLLLALLAFSGLGLEILIGLLIEPAIYGANISDWNTCQNVMHWCITCVVWGIVAILLVQFAKKKYGFELFAKEGRMKLWQWGVIVLLFAAKLLVSYLDWDGFKVIKEYNYNGTIKFIFQYIYYLFETILVLLVVVFGQKAGELWFQPKKFPYGGIVVALTWGLAHIFTQGDLTGGLITAMGGLVYGLFYLLTNRDVKLAYPIILLSFIL